jgi:hypothetical protein
MMIPYVHTCLPNCATSRGTKLPGSCGGGILWGRDPVGAGSSVAALVGDGYIVLRITDSVKYLGQGNNTGTCHLGQCRALGSDAQIRPNTPVRDMLNLASQSEKRWTAYIQVAVLRQRNDWASTPRCLEVRFIEGTYFARRASLRKMLLCARLHLLAQQTRPNTCPMFCRARSRSRSRTGAASVTTTN